MKIILIYSAGWIGMVALAIINGAVREKIYGPLMRELAAHQLSTVIGIVLFGLYMFILSVACRIESSNQAFLIGSIWVVMTVVFEFIFGHYIMKHPWSKLLHDYNLLEGRVWLLVLIWTAIGPYLFYRAGS